MPVLHVHCINCGADFIDSRIELKDGDEAICPKCGARHEFSREFVLAASHGLIQPDLETMPIHAEPDFRKPH